MNTRFKFALLRLMGLFFLVCPVAHSEIKAEFVFDTGPSPSCHASTVLEVEGGELLAAWFGGEAEGEKDVAIWLSRRDEQGWSGPEEVVREPDIPTWNPVLFRTSDGVVRLFYKFGPSPRQWTGGFRTSQDEGRTWSPIQHLPAGLLGPVKDKPLILPDGTIVAGTSVESYRSWTSWVERSTDNGLTWTRHGPIAHPQQPYGVIQPTIVRTLGGLRMFMRSRNIGRICFADSFDGGRNWSAARETSLPNPNSGIDAVGLKDGRIVLAYNHTERGRTPLNLAVSHDGGETWNRFLDLETATGEYSYPAIIQASGGNLHVTYTWKRQRIKHVEVPLEDIPRHP